MQRRSAPAWRQVPRTDDEQEIAIYLFDAMFILAPCMAANAGPNAIELLPA